MTAFSLASVFGVPIGLRATSVWGWHAPFVLVALASLPALALAIIGLPTMRGHLAQAPANRGLFAHYRGLLGDRGHLAALAMSVALTLSGFSVIPFMSTYMSINVGLDVNQLGYLYLIGGAVTVLTARLIGRLADRIGKHRAFVIIALFSTVPLVVLTRLPPLPLAAALAVSTVFMVLVSGRFIPASAMITATVAAPQRGSFMSLNSAVQSLVCGAATTMSSAIIVREGDGPLRHYDLVGLIACAATLIAIVLSRAVRTGDQSPPAAPSAPGAALAAPPAPVVD
jgi:predicted MFS family arabinose efflux permease